MSGKVLVFGCSGIVGSYIALALIKKGYTVIAPSRKVNGLEKLKEYIKGHENQLIAIEGDVGSEEEAEKLRQSVEKLGDLKHVVASLGPWIEKQSLTNSSLKDFNEAIHDKATVHFLAAKAFLPMIANIPSSSYTIISGGVGEFVVSQSSVLVTVGTAALYGVSLGLRTEFENAQVRVNEFRISFSIARDEDLHQLKDFKPASKVGEAVARLVEGSVRGKVLSLKKAEDLNQQF